LENKDKIILHLCAKEGSDSLPYKEAGYDVRIIGEDIGVENYNPPDNVYGIIANPPCTMFSVARTTAKIPRDLRQGMFLINECLRIIWECQYRIETVKINQSANSPLKFWVIENPGTGMLKWFLGKPVMSYHPYEWGVCFSKLTALWGLFNIPQKPLLFNPIPKGRRLADFAFFNMDKEKRMQARSTCCKEFAKAFFLANQ